MMRFFSLSGATIYKKIYDALGEGYVLNIHLAAPSEEGLVEADRIIKKIVFLDSGGQ